MVNERAANLSDDWIACEAERKGLAQALSLAPPTVRVASERAGRPLPTAPSGPLTDPAGAFDPAGHTDKP